MCSPARTHERSGRIEEASALYTLLVTTRGLRDQLQIGYQHRPKLFVKQIRLTPPLYDQVIEIDERLDAEGRILVPLDIAQAESALREARAKGFDACAIDDDLSSRRDSGTAFIACAHRSSVWSVTLAMLLNEPNVM